MKNKLINKIKLIKNIKRSNQLRLKNLSLYLLSSLISGIIGILFNPFLAANLSSLDYSIIGYFGSFGSLFTPILNFSLISFYVRKYFKIAPDKRQETLDTIISALLVWGLLSSLFIIALFYIYTKLNNVQISFYPFALMSIAQLFFNNFLLIYQINCRMQGDAKRYFNITISASLITIILSIFLVIILKFGAIGRMSAVLASALIIGVFSIKKTINKFRIDFNILKEAISFGWPVSVSYIIQYFLFGVNIAMLERLNDVTNMGLFVVASSISGYLSILTTGLSQTFEPDLYKAVAQYDYKKIFKIVSLIIIIFIPFILLFTILAKPVMSVLTYKRYTDAYYFARILSFGVLTTYLMVAAEGMINAFGFTKTVLINKIIGAVLAITAYQLLINNFQFVGAAWGSVLAPGIVFIVSIFSLIYIKPNITKMRYVNKN